MPGIPSGSKRLVPDVSLYSSPNLPGYPLLHQRSDQLEHHPGAKPASCNSGFRASSTDSELTAAGGTSFAAPIFAGMVALINQKAGYTTGQGLINPTLYKLAGNSSTYASAFHDITKGNNNCTAGIQLLQFHGRLLRRHRIRRGHRPGLGGFEQPGIGMAG